MASDERAATRQQLTIATRDSLLGGIHDAIKEQGDWKVSGAAKYDDDDERRSVFRYRRPEIDHISTPEAFDAEALEELFEIYGHAKDEWDQHVADYVSDSEGDPSDGRVSPCTFLHWVNGAKRWDAPGDKNKSRWEARQTYDVPVRATEVPCVAHSFFWADQSPQH